jgi:hypothetical protein
MWAASADERYERAATLRRRHERLAALLGRLGGVLEATHERSRLVVCAHPTKPRWDALWVVAGRVIDWGPLDAGGGASVEALGGSAHTRPAAEPAGATALPVDEIHRRSVEALARRPRPGARTAVPADEVDEVRIVGGWLAGHEADELPLEAAADRGALAGFLAGVTGR